MIIRHDIDPTLYLANPDDFSAIAPLCGHPEEIPIAYDNIDEMLKPSLLNTMAPEPEVIFACDGMGTLIAPTWLLSAAHVATNLTTDDKITFEGTPYPIQQVVLHPHWQNHETDITQVQNDIALVQLIRAPGNVVPLPLYQQPDEQQQIVTLIGQGDYGNGLIGPNDVDGKLRRATNRIESVTDTWLMFKFDAPPAGTDLEGIAGPGDSGGPALLKTEKGWAIAGISAGQDSQGCGEGYCGEGYYGVWEYYTRVSQYLAWIESVVGT